MEKVDLDDIKWALLQAAIQYAQSKMENGNELEQWIASDLEAEATKLMEWLWQTDTDSQSMNRGDDAK